MEGLKGYKTYLTAAAIGIAAAANYLGWIDSTTANTILGMLAGLGLIFARVGTVKS